MKYSIVHDGIRIELPAYSFDTDDKIAAINNEVAGGVALRKISRKIYDFCEELVGTEVMSEAVGEFASCDPNELQILYKEILAAYAEPLVAYEQDKLNSMYDLDAIEKVIGVAEKAKTFGAV